MRKAIMNPKVVNGRCPACGLKFGRSPALAYVVFYDDKKYNPNCSHCVNRAGKEMPGVIL